MFSSPAVPDGGKLLQGAAEGGQLLRHLQNVGGLGRGAGGGNNWLLELKVNIYDIFFTLFQIGRENKKADNQGKRPETQYGDIATYTYTDNNQPDSHKE